MLIEFLKKEYLGDYWKLIDGYNFDYEHYKDNIEPYFEVHITRLNLGTFNFAKMYKILDKQTAHIWDVIVGPVAMLYSNNMQKCREELLEKHTIKGIITLKNSFFDSTAIPSAIIILNSSESKTWLTSATETNDLITIISEIKSYSRKVYFTDQLEATNMMPEYYNDEKKKINTELDKYNTKALKEIADVSIGKSVSRDDFGDNGIPYLRARNLCQGKIVNVDAFVKEKEARKYAKQLLQEGDLLLSKNFGEHRVVQVGIDDIPAIISNGLFLIRPYGVPDSYLYKYFSSDTGKKILDKQLESIEKGSTIISINLKDLRELRIPLFNVQTMINLSQVEKLQIPDLVSLTKELTPYIKGVELELKIYEDFINAGWDKDEVVINSTGDSISLGQDVKYEVDITLRNNGQLLAIVEVKTNFSITSIEWLQNMYALIRSGQVPFLILTNGIYYEIHSRHDNHILKKTKVPKKDDLLLLLNEKEDN